MIVHAPRIQTTATGYRWWLILAIVVCGLAFYYVEHDYTVSQYLETLDESTVELDEIVAAGNTTRRIAFAAVGLFGLLGWILHGRRDYRLLSLAGMLFCSYFAWCFASALWADDVGLTLRRFGVLLFMFLGVMGISKQLSARQLCWLVVGVGAAHLCWGIVAEIQLGMFYPWRAKYRFAGTIHPNSQGIQCAALCLAALCLAADTKRAKWPLLALAFCAALFLVLTKSRTSCAALVLAAVVTWLPQASRLSKATAFVFAPFLVTAALLMGLLLNFDIANRFTQILLLGREEEASTLTGRLPLWTELMGYIRARPLVGYGYGGFWNVGRMRAISESQGWQIAHSHSAYLETVLNLGLIGAAILFTCVATAMVIALLRYQRGRDPGYRFICGFTTFAAIYSITDAGFALPNFMSLILLSGLAITAFSRLDAEHGSRTLRSSENQKGSRVSITASSNCQTSVSTNRTPYV